MRRFIAVALLAGSASAAEPEALRALFPSEADVFAEGSGLVRLDLPPEVIASCRPDLSDVRLFDPAGNEVPFLLDAPRAPAARATERFEPRLLDVRRAEEPRAQGPTFRHESYVLGGPPKPSSQGPWVLVLEGMPREFVTKARVKVEPPSPATTLEIVTTLFRLATPRAAEKIRLPLGPGAAPRVTVDLDYEGPVWLQPAFHFESARSFEAGGTNAVPLRTLSTRRSDGTTTIELDRPRGVVPESLRVSSSTATFDRKLTIHDAGPGRDATPLGSGAIFRLLPGTGVEELEIALRPARGDRLSVVIEDGDSPPLGDLEFNAVFGRPTLVASLTSAGSDTPTAILRFGGGRARVPRYDLAGLAAVPGREVYGQRAEALVRMYDPAATIPARLGPMRANREFDRAPVLQFAMHPGAAIGRGVFARTRPLEVTPAPEGLSRLRLTPEDLAALRPDLGDLRIVDEQSRQWPYLVDRSSAAADVPLAIGPTKTSSRRSRYRLTPPIEHAAFDRLALEVEAPYFDRAYRLTGERDDGSEQVLAEGRLVRAGTDSSPVMITLGAARIVGMELVVEDGDDAPLAVTKATARAPVADLYIAAPAARYALLLGAPDVLPPSYELERVRDVVLSVEAGEVRAGALVENPDYRMTSRFLRGSGREQAIFWGVLVAAVILLAVFTLRLARR